FLHVANAAGDRDNRVVFWKHNAILAERAVAAIAAVTTKPELVTVALIPIAFRAAPIGSLPRGGGLYPFLRQQLFAVPISLAQIEQPKLRNAFGANVQAEALEVNTGFAGVPLRTFDSVWLKKAALQILQDILAGRLV